MSDSEVMTEAETIQVLLGDHRSAIEGTCTVLDRTLAIRYTLERSGFWRSEFENANPIETVAAAGFQPDVCYDGK